MTTSLSGPDVQPDTPEAVRPGLMPRVAAEAFGTMFVALAGLGVPLFTIPQSSPLPAPLAAGLAVTAAMLAVGHVSGGHFNPAITLGHLVAGRIRAGAAAAYALAQVAGAAVGALLLFAVLRTLPGIADSRTAFDTVTAGFGEHSIIQAPLAAALLLEVVGAAIIVAVFLGAAGRGAGVRATGVRRVPARDSGGAVVPVAVGLSFAALLQLGQAVGNLPFNPARAAASAVFSSGWALEQLWVFVVAPLAGAAVAGALFRLFRMPSTALAEAAPTDGSGGAAAGDESAPAERTGAAAQADAGSPAGATAAVRGDGPAEADEAREFFDGKRG